MIRIVAVFLIGVVLLSACGREPAKAPVPVAGPATAPADRPVTVESIRAMIKEAIAMEDDPEQARALFARAVGKIKELPPGSDRRGLIIEFNPAKESVAHLAKSADAKTVEERKKLSAHIEVVETYESGTIPFTAMADNGRGALVPMPMAFKDLKSQRLERDGKTVYDASATPEAIPQTKVYFVSPDEKYVVLEDHDHPTEILVVETGAKRKVAAPKIENHYYVFPFVFEKWDADSRSFRVTASGTFSEGPGKLMAFRELWQVDAASAKATFVKRQTQPYGDELKWED